MRLTRIATILLVGILLVSTISCKSTYQPPKATYYNTGSGAAVGTVVYPNSSVAGGLLVVIFKLGGTQSYTSTSTDNHGYYLFDNMPPGNFEIYVFSPSDGSYIYIPSDVLSDTTISISAGETTNVSPIVYKY